jgi:hypothetical protein
MLATVDVPSKGRLTVGVGVGWMSEEIALLGGPPFAERAQASEECIQAFRELCTAEKPVQRGPYAAFDKLLFAPKSAQLRGSARQWVVPRRCQSSHFPRHSAALWRRACGSACRGGKGRSRSWSDCGHNSRHLLTYQNRTTRSRRRPTRGSVQAIVDDIDHFQERGLQRCVIGGDGEDLQGTLELLELFASEVMAKCD